LGLFLSTRHGGLGVQECYKWGRAALPLRQRLS
jgi:hypothetical protein